MVQRPPYTDFATLCATNDKYTLKGCGSVTCGWSGLILERGRKSRSDASPFAQSVLRRCHAHNNNTQRCGVAVPMDVSSIALSLGILSRP